MRVFLIWLLAVVIAVIGISASSRRSKHERVRARQRFLHESALAVVDVMTGTGFEQYVARLLHHRGYSDVTVVGSAGDGGVDILAVSPDGMRAAFQCKRQASNVSVQVVRQPPVFVEHVNHVQVQAAQRCVHHCLTAGFTARTAAWRGTSAPPLTGPLSAPLK